MKEYLTRRRSKVDVNRLMIGSTFGRWFVVKEGKRKNGSCRWLCKCVCGTYKLVAQTSLEKGLSKSCGCYQKDHPSRLEHGEAKTSLNYVWSAIKQRCRNPKNKQYSYYGGRGIQLDACWNNYINFRDYIKNILGPKPFKRATIDRIDTNKNYEPGNLRWATYAEQMRNTRRTRMITFENKTLCIMDWSKEKGIHWRTLYARLDRGLTIEEALK